MPEGTAVYSAEMGRRMNNALRPASVSVAVGVEATDVRTVVFQILDGNGAPAVGKRMARVTVWTSAAQAALATGGTTGIAAASGTILVLAATAKKVFDFLSDVNGKINLTWTDTGTESVAVSAHVDGVTVCSAAFANA